MLILSKKRNECKPIAALKEENNTLNILHKENVWIPGNWFETS